jgi:hypothetical protein
MKYMQNIDGDSNKANLVCHKLSLNGKQIVPPIVPPEAFLTLGNKKGLDR